MNLRWTPESACRAWFTDYASGFLLKPLRCRDLGWFVCIEDPASNPCRWMGEDVLYGETCAGALGDR